MNKIIYDVDRDGTPIEDDSAPARPNPPQSKPQVTLNELAQPTSSIELSSQTNPNVQ